MKLSAVIIVLCLLGGSVLGQLKEQEGLKNFSESLAKPQTSLLSGIAGIFASDRFSMNHTFSASFLSFGGNSLMVNSYLNSMQYQLSAPLLLKVNLGIMNTPYSSFNNVHPGLDLNATNFIGSAELHYQPTSNAHVKIGVGVAPRYYSPLIHSPYLVDEDN